MDQNQLKDMFSKGINGGHRLYSEEGRLGNDAIAVMAGIQNPDGSFSIIGRETFDDNSVIYSMLQQNLPSYEASEIINKFSAAGRKLRESGALKRTHVKKTPPKRRSIRSLF